MVHDSWMLGPTCTEYAVHVQSGRHLTRQLGSGLGTMTSSHLHQTGNPFPRIRIVKASKDAWAEQQTQHAARRCKLVAAHTRGIAAARRNKMTAWRDKAVQSRHNNCTSVAAQAHWTVSQQGCQMAINVISAPKKFPVKSALRGLRRCDRPSAPPPVNSARCACRTTRVLL